MDKVMTKKDFPKVFKRVWEESTPTDDPQNGFRRCGLCPLNRSGIDKTKPYPEPASTEPASNILIATREFIWHFRGYCCSFSFGWE